MLRSVAVQRITDGLGFRSDLADKVILRMQEEQRDLERGKTLPRFMRTSTFNAVQTIAGFHAVDYPTDFLRRDGDFVYYASDELETAKIVPWRSYIEATRAFPTDAIGIPEIAVAMRDYIVFYPTPDQAYYLYWSYYAKADILDSDIENAWLANAPELIIGGAGLRMALDIRNKSAQELFGAIYKEARQTWFNETIVDEQDDMPLILGANA